VLGAALRRKAVSGTIKAFDFDINSHGASVIVSREPLCPRCLSDGEVDANVQQLKANLDAVAKQMKAAIRKQAVQPLQLG
jgi:hypothetical protein